MLLSQLPNGAHALVKRVFSGSSEVDQATVQRLEELGFIAGEPVLMLRRGPGGREPLAVQVGETMFALRLVEACSVEVSAPDSVKALA
ncbi:FeoA family protein [Rhodoferax sp. GW822-FHT02A01]|uniref:FeoA family protein n=1 Tax=Rhodoferax sp. GW822-FHT02A01 TaxID=3141537 RepID=UPI00315CDA3E